jgi:hypothetical protein
MAVAIKMDFAGVTQEQYDSVVADMDLGGRPAPQGVFHVAGPIPGGWRVIDVWETQEAFDRFAQAKILPLAQKHGMTQSPQIEIWPVHGMLK